jgi:hypothetical protein
MQVDFLQLSEARAGSTSVRSFLPGKLEGEETRNPCPGSRPNRQTVSFLTGFPDPSLPLWYRPDFSAPECDLRSAAVPGAARQGA